MSQTGSSASPAAGADVERAFDPSGVAWTRVSGRLAQLRRMFVLLAALVVVLAGGLAAVFSGFGWLWVIPALALIAAAIGWVLIGRQVRAWGYAERADDFLVTRGLLFRVLVVVPYGRMQFVDVQAGPLERALRIASVQLHTASAHTDARIPGLPPEEAARLRDQLASRGQAQLAGL